MAIVGKPEKKSASEKDIFDLINRGGSVSTQAKSSADLELKEKQLSLRVPLPLIDKIATSIKKRTIRIPRHTWILEAIIEKLSKEEEAKNNMKP
ncbi:hypothetical protein Bealeia1_02016 (plasmid) [Candidatus Bealeia paramacronuclearis]|uniref:Uncharacterized protein n=1 Tax=Candidatus Bealeia paramacronuclearis TaxID=1921001 RepID=A0ABZ2C5N8_9PROT|nr:hypothetical protein [Candidatus Bealeia paramacronuclearis]